VCVCVLFWMVPKGPKLRPLFHPCRCVRSHSKAIRFYRKSWSRELSKPRAPAIHGARSPLRSRPPPRGATSAACTFTRRHFFWDSCYFIIRPRAVGVCVCVGVCVWGRGFFFSFRICTPRYGYLFARRSGGGGGPASVCAPNGVSGVLFVGPMGGG